MMKSNLKQVILVAGLCGLAILSYSPAWARGEDRWEGHDRGRPEIRHDRHPSGGVRFYDPGWFGLQFFFGSPSVGATVRVLPFGSSRVVVRGVEYSYFNHVYYRRNPYGYVVVPDPWEVNQVVYAPAVETVVVNVPNTGGGYTAVTLTRSGSGYFGPQGEYYANNPTVEQLRVLYAR